MAALVYELVTPDRYQEALDLFNNYFLPHNPVLVPVHCTTQVDLMDKKILSLLKEGLSWCAIDKETGKMVGVRITGSETLEELPDVMPTFDEFLASGWSKEWAAVWILLCTAMDTKKILIANQENKILELFALCVQSDYRKKNIATELVKRTLDHGKSVGFKFAGVICTSAFAQRLFEKLEFTKVEELFYSTYIDIGSNTALFKDVEEPHRSAATYVKKL